MPEISVIVPVYNVEKYIHRCVDSILAQTYTDFELILVDDGSPDNCGKICDEYAEKDTRIKVIHKKNGGLSSARNAGLDIAKGDYIYFLDGDDYIKTDLLEKTIPFMRQNYDMVVFNMYALFSDGSLKKYDYHYSGIVEITDNEKVDTIIGNFTNKNIGWEAWNRIYKRSIIEKHHIRFVDNKLIFAEDMYFFLCYISHCSKIISLYLSLYIYRIRDDSIMGKEKIKPHFNNFNELAKALYNHYLYNNDCKNLIKFFPIIFYAITQHGYSAYINESKEDFFSASKQFRESINDFSFVKKNFRKLIAYQRYFFRFYNSLESIYVFNQLQYCVFGNKILLSVKDRIVPIKHKIITKIKILQLSKKYSSPKKKRVFLLGTEDYGNIGNHKISETILQFIKENCPDCCIFQIGISDCTKNIQFLPSVIKDNDLILLPGGGNIGDLYTNVLKMHKSVCDFFPKNKKIIFPQTIFFSDLSSNEFHVSQKLYTPQNKITLFTRDAPSYEFAKSAYSCNVFLTPDIVLYCNEQKEFPRQKQVLFVMRSDSEKSVDDKQIKSIKEFLIQNGYLIKDTDFEYPFHIPKTFRHSLIEQKLDLCSSSSLVITDRLHGMIFSAITGTPCIAINNYNRKVQYQYEWLTSLQYVRMAKNEDEILSFLPVLLDEKETTYDNSNYLHLYEQILKEVNSTWLRLR